MLKLLHLRTSFSLLCCFEIDPFEDMSLLHLLLVSLPLKLVLSLEASRCKQEEVDLNPSVYHELSK